MESCPVKGNCKTPTHCPFCVNGSEYRPIDRSVLFPAEAARVAGRKVAKREWKTTEQYRGGKRSARKGKRLEREAAAVFGGARVPLSGALEGLPNDVVLLDGLRAEVKGRGNGFGVLYGWLAKADVVIFPSVHGDLVLMGSAHFQCLQAGVLPETWRVLRKDRSLKQLEDWLAAEQADLLLLKADRRDWLVVLRAAVYKDLMAKADEAGPDKVVSL